MLKPTFRRTATWAAVLFVAVISACGSGNTARDKLEVEIFCDEANSEQYSEVFAVVQDHKLKISNLLNCEVPPQEALDSLSLPGDAIQPVMGSWHGFESIVYARMQGDSVVQFYQNSLDPNLPYQHLLARFEHGLFQWLRPALIDHLVGLYEGTLGDNGFLLFLGLRDQHLSAEMFEYEGELPDTEEINRLLPFMDRVYVDTLDVNVANLVFQSDIGRGFFSNTDEGMQIVFQEFRDQGNLELHLIRE